MAAPNTVRRPWSTEEDAALLQLVHVRGVNGAWPDISLSMDSRTGKQCRERYVNHLDPDTKRSAWTMEESAVIRDMFPTHGTKWSQYISALPGRSDNAIKNRYHLISRNNFEYCTDIRVIVAIKRPLTELSTDDLGSDTMEGESRTDDKRKRLNMLIAARAELDRGIDELEQVCLTAHPPTPPVPTSHREIFAAFKVEVPCEETHAGFNLNLDWTDPDTPMAFELLNAAYGLETINEV